MNESLKLLIAALEKSSASSGVDTQLVAEAKEKLAKLEAKKADK